MPNNKSKSKHNKLKKKLDKKSLKQLKKQMRRPKVYFKIPKYDYDDDVDSNKVICTTTGLEPGEIAATNYIEAKDIMELKAEAYNNGFRVLRSLTVAKYKSFNNYKEILYATPVILASYLEDINEDTSEYSSYSS